MYTVNNKTTKCYGSVIGIREYCINNKWKTLRNSIGNSKEPLTDEALTEFILKYKPVEINLILRDKRGEIHYVDFPIEDLVA